MTDRGRGASASGEVEMLRRPTIAVEAASGDATTFRWPRFLVLVAALEDNVSPVRAAVRDDARLELLGAVAHAAACVARAVASLPDLIVIDADLPGGALAATSEIRARLPITHAVIMHAGAEDDDAFVEATPAGPPGA